MAMVVLVMKLEMWEYDCNTFFCLCLVFALGLDGWFVAKRCVGRTLRTIERKCTFCMNPGRDFFKNVGKCAFLGKLASVSWTCQTVGRARDPSQKREENAVLLSALLVELVTLTLFMFTFGFTGQTAGRTGNYLQLLSSSPIGPPTNQKLVYLCIYD